MASSSSSSGSSSSDSEGSGDEGLRGAVVEKQQPGIDEPALAVRRAHGEPQPVEAPLGAALGESPTVPVPPPPPELRPPCGAGIVRAGIVRARKRPASEVADLPPANRSLRPGGSSSSSDSGTDSSNASDTDIDSCSDEEDSEPSDLDGEEEVDREIEDAGGILKDLVVKSEPVPVDASYKGDWAGCPTPGSSGFNRFAARVMWKARVARKKAASAPPGECPYGDGCPPLQPHQEAVAFLLHPQSPVTRLLVDHPTGSGKTREMIRVLDNFFHDPRPKVPIFPKEPVCRNFYAELLRWPSRYRDFFACLRPQDATRASGVRDWKTKRAQLWDVSGLPGSDLKELCINMREVLEMKGWFFMGKMRRSRREAFYRRYPDEAAPAAPLRALRYTSAGGRHAELRPDGLPVSALLKVAFDRATANGNAYSNKVVIMDEVHNLVRVQTQFGEQLDRLRLLLAGATGSVLAGFTGTPILNEAAEGRCLLDIIKGRSQVLKGDGGFLSSFPMRPAGLFPLSLPLGIPDKVLTPNLRRQFVRRVFLTGEPLKRYDVKCAKGLPERRLRAYCNLCVHFGSLHDGKNGSKARVLADMAGCAPKLHAIAKDIAENSEKALVLVARSSGLEALLAHLQELASSGGQAFGVATMEELAEFNAPSNVRGEQYRVLVADAAQCSEGVSFFAVRRVHLADVPVTPSALHGMHCSGAVFKRICKDAAARERELRLSSVSVYQPGPPTFFDFKQPEGNTESGS
ncbi:unnamed protein product [Polarella glacialis]|uniref:Uncharacterized protein n=1 Tax=Polarella glacialis TaxID=89957 RepID=A0A813KUW5_POLGL|nr:unnamed protein product [Polarella glacialis]